MKKIMILLSFLLVALPEGEALSCQQNLKELTFAMRDITRHDPEFAVIEEVEIFEFPGRENHGRFGRKRQYTIGLGYYEHIGETIDNPGGVVLVQIKLPVNQDLFWGYYAAYCDARTFGDYNAARVYMWQFYPYVDYYPQEYFNIFLRGASGFNAWRYGLKDFTNWPINDVVKESGFDLMIAVGGGVNLGTWGEVVALYNRILTGDFAEDYFTITLGFNFGR